MILTINMAMFGIALVLGLIPFLLTARLKLRLPKLRLSSQVDGYSPPAAVILPCKGLDPGFRENVLALLTQDYPSLQLLFVVATEDDPAHRVLKEVLDMRAADSMGGKATLLIAGICRHRAQKLTNQLAAVQQVGEDVQVLVFIDSDCRPDPNFVRRLVAPLKEAGVGATTGYRWYHPPRPTLGSLLRSTWNAGALPFLIDRKRTHAWGGAMALRRETFAQAGIAEAWNNAVSDDMTLTVAVRQLGLELRFVPQCIAVSYEESTLGQTLEFTNRQSLISRIYLPPLWWGTALGHASANVFMIYGLVSFIAWTLDGGRNLLAGAFCMVLLPLQWMNAAWLFGSARELLPASVCRELDELRWHYVLTAPLASMMTLINTAHAATTRRMTWRGIEYELRSPTETIVLSTKN